MTIILSRQSCHCAESPGNDGCCGHDLNRFKYLTDTVYTTSWQICTVGLRWNHELRVRTAHNALGDSFGFHGQFKTMSKSGKTRNTKLVSCIIYFKNDRVYGLIIVVSHWCLEILTQWNKKRNVTLQRFQSSVKCIALWLIKSSLGS